MSACCPPGSIPAVAKRGDYKEKGEWKTTSTGLEVYVVSPQHDNENTGSNATGKCIVILQDLYGAKTSRHSQVADTFAEKGFLVIMPNTDGWPEEWDLVSAWGKLKNLWWFIPWLRRHRGPQMTALYKDKLLPFLKEQGVTSFGYYGMCLGAYNGIWLQAAVSELESGGDGDIALKAATSGHPSIDQIIQVTGEKLEAVAKHLAKAPVLYMPAGNDPPTVKEGGKLQKLVRDQGQGLTFEIKEFPDMQHGWTNRGDETDEKVRENIQSALTSAASFFEAHL